jgi:hypothetical protein
MSESFAYFLTQDPNTVELPLPVQNTDRVAVVRDTVTYWSTLTGTTPGSYVYVVPTNGSTQTAVGGQPKYQFNPAAPLASLNVVLPPTPVDGQTFQIRTSRDITTLNVTAPSGSTVNGTGFVLAGGGSVEYLYVLSEDTWFVG